MPKTTIRCVCGAWISIEGHGNDTIMAKKNFIDRHKPCREHFDKNPESKFTKTVDAVTRTMQ